jgi:homocitrate synthase NifV
VRIADTVGIANPLTVASLVAFLKQHRAPALEFHAHNDCGMAAANAVTAVMSGAESVSVTVLGIGERAGNAALEQVAMALHVAGVAPATPHSRNLAALCTAVAAAARIPIPRDKPIAGANAFRHESGIHCAALLSDSRAYQPFDPAVTGRAPMEFVIGKHSGSRGAQRVLANQGRPVTREQARSYLEKIKTTHADTRNPKDDYANSCVQH